MQLYLSALARMKNKKEKKMHSGAIPCKVKQSFLKIYKDRGQSVKTCGQAV